MTTLNIADTKTVAINNSLTFAGTDGTTMTFPGASGTVVTVAGVPNYLSGLTLSTTGGSPNFIVDTGAAADGTNAALMTLVSALTKTTNSWMHGNNQGGLDTGSIATATWYHVYLIANSSGATVDVVFSQSPSSPAMPGGYTLFRRIGSMLTDGSGDWTAFKQNGDDFAWSAPSGYDYNTFPTAGTAFHVTTRSPTGVSVKVRVCGLTNTTAAGNGFYVWDEDLGSSYTPSISFVGGLDPRGIVTAYTNTSAQVYCMSDDTSLMRVQTLGWSDSRGKL